MRVSVIIPVLNGADRLGQAVASVRRQLCTGDEIIIVDDGSTDDTPAVIADFGAAVLSFRQDNAGPATARNRGLREATGDVIAFIDHDDLWAPGRQTAMLAALRADPTADIVVGKVQTVVDSGTAQLSPDDRRSAIIHQPWLLQTLLIRRIVFDRIGHFDERLRHASDADWMMRARDTGVRIVEIDDLVAIYHLHSTNMSRNVAVSRDFLLQALKAALDRRRSAAAKA
jgi:glycosyltransferase involved in cell wall biosynthesis